MRIMQYFKSKLSSSVFKNIIRISNGKHVFMETVMIRKLIMYINREINLYNYLIF